MRGKNKFWNWENKQMISVCVIKTCLDYLYAQ